MFKAYDIMIDKDQEVLTHMCNLYEVVTATRKIDNV